MPEVFQLLNCNQSIISIVIYSIKYKTLYYHVKSPDEMDDALNLRMVKDIFSFSRLGTKSPKSIDFP